MFSQIYYIAEPFQCTHTSMEKCWRYIKKVLPIYFVCVYVCVHRNSQLTVISFDWWICHHQEYGHFFAMVSDLSNRITALFRWMLLAWQFCNKYHDGVTNSQSSLYLMVIQIWNAHPWYLGSSVNSWWYICSVLQTCDFVSPGCCFANKRKQITSWTYVDTAKVVSLVCYAAAWMLQMTRVHCTAAGITTNRA